jgi:hypothetical protein
MCDIHFDGKIQGGTVCARLSTGYDSIDQVA